jgi:DNA-binding XRE family transcriptional regulator
MPAAGACRPRDRSVDPVRNSDLAAIARLRASFRTGAARQARIAAGISITEIASAAGVSRQAVGSWEQCRSIPSAEHALAYAKVLAAVTAAAA